MDARGINWGILVVFGIAMYAISPRARGKDPMGQFFGGKDDAGRETSGFFLTSSVLISWIFAKSVQNAADLGQKFGLPGGTAYAAYWLSFLVAGGVLYPIRQRRHLAFVADSPLPRLERDLEQYDRHGAVFRSEGEHGLLCRVLVHHG